jgi:hypothetical protein
MADDFSVTAGSGTPIRAVEKSGKKAQVVVLDLGGAGAESLLTLAALTANQPVFLAPATVSGTVTAAYVAAVTLSCPKTPKKTIIITNTHATLTLLYKIDGYAKSGSAGFDPIIEETTLDPLTTDIHTISDYYDEIIVSVMDGTGHATYTIDTTGGP